MSLCSSDLEMDGHNDVHLVSHLQIIYDAMACAYGHARDYLDLFFSKIT